MQTTTTSEILPIHLEMKERSVSPLSPQWITAVERALQKVDWDRLIVRADRAISVAGAAVLVAAFLYFAPVFMNILTR